MFAFILPWFGFIIAVNAQAAQQQTMNLVGDAVMYPNGDGTSFVRLTKDYSSVGGMFIQNPFKISDGGWYSNDGFVATFKIRGVNGSHPVADGIAFVVHGFPNGTLLGGGGGNMGVPSGSANMVHGFRLDWFNDWDGYDVVMEDFSNNNYMSGLWNRSGDNYNYHSVAVSYQQSSQTLSIIVDDKYTGIYNTPMYPNPHSSEYVYVGLTAGTGGFWMNFDVDNSFALASKHFTQAILFGVATSYDDPTGGPTVVRLVQYTTYLAGGMYHPKQLAVRKNGASANDGFVFSATFRAYRQIGSDPLADGFAFVIYNSSRPGIDPDANGGAVGIPAQRATGIKFDYYYSTSNVTLLTFNSSIIGVNGFQQGTTGLYIQPNTNWQNLVITYDHTRTQVSVALSGMNFDGSAYSTVNTFTHKLYNDGVDNVWVGITSGTGYYRMTLEVQDNMVFTEINPRNNVVDAPKKKSNKTAVGLGVGLTFGIIGLIAIIAGVMFFVKKKGFSISLPTRSTGGSSLGGNDSLSTTNASLEKL